MQRTAKEQGAEETKPMPSPAEVKDKELLSAEEMAVVLGCGRTTAYSLLRTGEIPSFTFRRLRRVRRQDIDAYVEERLGAGS
jgi:excisionase family DNA binding protein